MRPENQRLTPAQLVLAALPVALALMLGFANLGVPSIWHDEAVHVMVAKSIAETGYARLPSGETYYNANIFNAIVALFIKLWGHSEAVVRAPSVLFGALAVALTYCVSRPLIGHIPALVAAFTLALSPWQVAWSREARFYTLHEVAYLAMLWSVWRYGCATTTRRTAVYALAGAAAYGVGVFVSLHSIVFLGTVMTFAFFMALCGRRWVSRWSLLLVGAGVAAGCTVLGYRLVLYGLDRFTVFERAGLGGRLPDAFVDHVFAYRWYYYDWLCRNLSRGYFVVMALGSLLLLLREGRRGLFAALGFWTPFLTLSLLIGYRQDRFLFFAFPFYAVAVAYALVTAARLVFAPKRRWFNWILTVFVLLIAARLGLSAWRLGADTLDTARGANVTLARRHPQWRKPCAYVKARRDADTAVITTTFLPTLYYVGHVDNWFPSRTLWWEERECGLEGIKDVEALKAFINQHPKGLFLAERRRFAYHAKGFLAEDVAWVEAHMKRVEEACSADVTVYAWGDASDKAKDAPPRDLKSGPKGTENY